MQLLKQEFESSKKVIYKTPLQEETWSSSKAPALF